MRASKRFLFLHIVFFFYIFRDFDCAVKMTMFYRTVFYGKSGIGCWFDERGKSFVVFMIFLSVIYQLTNADDDTTMDGSIASAATSAITTINSTSTLSNTTSTVTSSTSSITNSSSSTATVSSSTSTTTNSSATTTTKTSSVDNVVPPDSKWERERALVVLQ